MNSEESEVRRFEILGFGKHLQAFVENSTVVKLLHCRVVVIFLLLLVAALVCPWMCTWGAPCSRHVLSSPLLSQTAFKRGSCVIVF
jgi:hypothetical protein